MTALRRRAAAALAATLVATVAVSGCTFDGAYDLPLPGSPVDEDASYEVTIDFADILNVVPRSPVMVDDVTVGEVTDVERVGWHARIKVRVRDDVELPDNAIADIRQVSLLGEKYVALEPPPGRQPVGRLSDGDTIPLSATGRNPEVEEVLGALSFLLSGGGVGQIQTISTELNKVMTGRQDRLRHLLGELDSFVGTLDDQKQDIISALDSVNGLARTLNRERRTVGTAIDTLAPAARVLADQHEQLMVMLRQLDRLGVVGTRVMNGTREDLLADLRHLRPVLHKLNEAGSSLPNGLSLFISFPFPKEASEVVKGDFANTSIAMDIRLGNLFKVPKAPGPGVPELPLPDVPDLPELPGVEVPEVPAIPGLPPIPGLPGNVTSGYDSVNRSGGFLEVGSG
jgi:phospholipid/cholesterol/gamma-HCH transport system substrate-binding protein